MRILMVHNINRVAEHYAQEMKSRGHVVTIYHPSTIGGLAPKPIKLAMMPWRVLDMRKVVGKLNHRYFDIMHIHWASYGVLGLISSIPYVLECRGDEVRGRTNRAIFRLALTPIFRRAAAVRCSTPDLLPWVRPLRSDVVFAPSAIETEVFAPTSDHAAAQPHPWTIFLHARLDPEKGVDVTTQALARFAQRHAAVRVILLDNGSLSSAYKQRYAGRFEFAPRIPQTDTETLRDLLVAADVVIGQVHLGAIGRSELEAMSCAKPVIASFHYPDAYSSPPPLCQATTVEEVDAHLEDLYQHPEKGRALGQAAREWVIAHHDQHVLADQLDALYQSLL